MSQSQVDIAPSFEGQAVLYCEKAFHSTDGKTTHGLLRFGRRFEVRVVVDSSAAGQDAGEALEGKRSGIPIVSNLHEASELLREGQERFFVVGLAVLGGRLAPQHRAAVRQAIERGFHIVSGLHDYVSEDPEFSVLGRQYQVRLIDIRKPPSRGELHAFSGKIEDVESLKVAILGTDSAIGKRTTAWKLVQALEANGKTAEMIGTGQTALMQGARYGCCMDALVNDFVAGELEHWTWLAWKERNPDVIVVEGQGSLLNPAFPGGFEIMAATRPDAVVLQHAPRRVHYEDFPRYPLHPLKKQIAAIEIISDRPVRALTINRQGIAVPDIQKEKERMAKEAQLPCFDPLDPNDMKALAQLLVALR